MSAITVACATTGCSGPGLEPPDRHQDGNLGGAQASSGGSSGMGGSGAGGMAGIGGMDTPGGGMGGGAVSGAGGAAGMAAGGSSGMMSPTGGMGGAMSGTGGAGTGASTDDAGTEDPGAPVMECEESREVIELSEVIGVFPLTCMMEAPEGTLIEGGTFSLAVTPAQDGVDGETTWSEHKQGADECGEDQAFYVDNSLGIPRLVLCPALCDSLTALSEDTATTEGKSVTVEIIYGCEAPQ